MNLVALADENSKRPPSNRGAECCKAQPWGNTNKAEEPSQQLELTCRPPKEQVVTKVDGEGRYSERTHRNDVADDMAAMNLHFSPPILPATFYHLRLCL